MDPATIAIIIEGLIALGKEFGPAAIEAIAKLASGEDPMTALDHERVKEILPHPLALAAVRAVERARRGLPSDDAPSAPSDR